MFRNLQIWAKFGTVLSVPLLGLAILAGLGISRSIDVAGQSNQTEKVATFDEDLARLIYELRTENFTTQLVLLDAGEISDEALRALERRQWGASEQAATTIREHSPILATERGGPFHSALARSMQDLERVRDIRDKLRGGDVSEADAGRAYAVADVDLGVVKRLATDATRDRLTTIATALRSSADRSIVSYTVAVVVVLALAVGVSLPMTGVMVRSLHRLRDASLDVAERRLPTVVAELQRARSIEDLELGTAPVAVDSRDEIGQVARAFNTVHRVAVRTAVEQGALRRSIGDMFTNMARRSQSLVDRQIKLIDELERAEDDPDTLASLFKLDHLATRMRRNAENLLVLSGTEPTRRWGQPVGLVRVVRAAIAEVEDYTRVELLGIDNLPLAGRCVGDVVHLLAELIENATSFSPPNTKVRIAGEAAARGYVLEIEDCGVGMSDGELLAANQRLADPPVIELALDRMLGFFVVGRLAQRHGLKVELRHSWYGGVTALVMLPEQVLVMDAAAPRTARDPVPPRAGRPAPGVLSGRPAARDPWSPLGAGPPHGEASLPRRGAPQPPTLGDDPRGRPA